jgi:class 3 adenylate cyclase
MGAIRRKSFDDPDEVRRFERGVGELVNVGPLGIGRGRLLPGWRWSTDVGPLARASSCQVHHLNMVISGRFCVRMDDGETVVLVANDVAEVPPGHDAWVVGDEPVVLLDFYGNAAALGVPSTDQRIVTTIVMTDIVDSTATAARLGDSAWRQRLAAHNRIVRARLDSFRGHEVNTTGDGFLTTFASAAAAVRCAASIRDAIRDSGIEVRAGVHTGEVEVAGDRVAGIGVHVGARIGALAEPGQVLVSGTVRDLVAGSGLVFAERGETELRGVPGSWRLFEAVES